MFLYDAARKVNSKIKRIKKYKSGMILSPVRRIEHVFPPHSMRVAAMTFDDGPCALTPQGQNSCLTDIILDILREYGAKASFDVVGSTAANYPDEEGRPGDFTWSGIKFDHYPRFGHDTLAGVVNQPELTKKILDDGHEITSHTYSHRLFGPMRAVYGGRVHFETLSEVIDDLRLLHTFMENRFGITMTLSRPPHYIDKIPGGGTSYDAYRVLGYNYMAASFDGAGWLPEASYKKEIDAMVMPLKAALERDPDSLNGKIIFQKDGCNMELRTPIADALPLQLKILADYGYKIVSVSELLSISPFEDLDPAAPEFKYVKKLLDAHHTVGYRNNTFHGERNITADEFYLMACNPELLKMPVPMSQSDLFKIAREAFDFTLTANMGNSLIDLAMKLGVAIDEKPLKDKKTVSRRDACEILSKII